MSGLATQLLSVLKEIADFLPPDEELEVKRKWLDSIQSGGEAVAPEDLYGGSIKDYVARGGRAGAANPYQVYSPHGSQHLYWSSHSGDVHAMDRSRAEELTGQIGKMQATPDEDPDSHFQAITPDILRPEHTPESTSEMGNYYGDEITPDPNINPQTGKAYLPKELLALTAPEDLIKLDAITQRYQDGMIKTEDNPGVISDDGTIWGTGKRLIDNPQVPEAEQVRTTNGMRPLDRSQWAGKVEGEGMDQPRGSTLKNHIASYEGWMLRQGLSVDQIEEGFEHILEANTLIDKAFKKRNDFNTMDMSRLSDLITTDGNHVFYIVQGQHMTMHDQVLARLLLERQNEPGEDFSDLRPSYDKSTQLISPDIQLSEAVEDKEKEAYDNLVGTTYEYLSGAQALLNTNPARARELIVGAAMNAKNAVNSIGDVMHMVTNGGTLDLEEASKSLDEYSLFKFIEEMNAHPQGWSAKGQPVDITDVKDVLYGMVYHLRNSLAAQAGSGLQAIDYTRTGDTKRNALEIQDGIYHYSDIGTAQEDALHKFGLHSQEGTELPVSLKAWSVFGDPTAKSGMHQARTTRQINGGGFKMLNFIKADSVKDIDRMMSFTSDAFKRITGRDLSPGVIQDYKDVYLESKKYHELVNLALHDEAAFDKFKASYIERVKKSGMNPGKQRKKLGELDKLNFANSKGSSTGKTFWVDRVKLVNTMLVDHMTAMANGDIEEIASAKGKRFIGLTTLLLSNAEIGKGNPDIGYMLNDNLKGQIHYTSQSRLLDEMISKIISSPGQMVYSKGRGEKDLGQSISIRRPRDFRKAALTSTFNKSSGLALSSKWSIDYIKSRIFSSHG